MRKSLCLLIGSLALCGAGCFGHTWSVERTFPNAVTTPTSTAVESATPTSSSLDMELSSRAFVDQRINVTSTGLSIEVLYPHLVPGVSSAAFDAAMDARILPLVDQFKSDFADAQKMAQGSADPTVGPTDADPWTLKLSYLTDSYGDYTQTSGTHIVSVLVSGSQYTQGAHSNPVYATLAYDLDTGKVLQLSDLFKPGTPYVKEISDAATAQLMKQHVAEDFSDANWIKSGAGPEEHNFQFFAVLDVGLEIYFPPYQIASYVDGPQSVLIPAAQLKGWKL